MSEEEKKAIQELTEIKELVEEDLKYDDYEVTATLDQIDLKSLVIVLNLIEKQQKEIEKKDKIINEMGEHIEKGCDFDSTIQTKQEVIEYFTKKVDDIDGRN